MAADGEELGADCDAKVDSVLAVGQRYLDSIDGLRAPDPAADTGRPTVTPSPGEGAAERSAQFRDALADVRRHAASVGCDADRFQARFRSGLSELNASGPVSRAVQQQLLADADGRTRLPGPLPAGGDLAAAVASTDAGGTLRLEPGTYRLDDVLVLLRGVTLEGAGRDATTIESAAGAAVVVLTDEPVALRGLTVRTSGTQPGTVVTAGPGADLLLSGARVSGGVVGPDGQDGLGVLMAAGEGGQTGPRRRTTLRADDVDVAGNGGGGVLLSGEHRLEATALSVTGNGVCGLCFVGLSDGVAADSVVEGSPAGVLVGGGARPVLRSLDVRGGEVGVQVLGTAAPELDNVRVEGASRASVVFADSATGVVRGATCTGSEFGLVVGPSAAPTVEGEGCQLARGQ